VRVLGSGVLGLAGLLPGEPRLYLYKTPVGRKKLPGLADSQNGNYSQFHKNFLLQSAPLSR